ncbi:MAG: AEC family transporter, partial [Zoogloea sp.]|nr:AEC family transporter [Zoogloea sp.]
MLTILGITGPIFIIIAIGFAAVRLGLLARTDMRVLGVFVINISLPALLFKALSQRALGELVSADLLIVYTLGSLLVAGLALGYVCLVQKRDLQSGALLALGMSASNSAYIGYPIALQVFGHAASAALAVYALVESLVMMPLALTLAEAGGSGGGRWHRVLGDILLRLAKNPFILAIAAGVAWAAIGVSMPAPLARVVDMLSTASAPVALFCIGGTLAGLHLKGLGADIGLIVVDKLLLHPLAVFVVALALPAMNAQHKTAAIVNACMPMMS